MTKIDENMYWMELTHLLSTFFSKPQGPFLYIYLYFEFLISSVNVHTREKQDHYLLYSPFCLHISVYVV
jgi:hypothetical protein